MPRPEKMTEIDRALEEVMKYDAKRRARARRLIPEELVEAMDYYVRWGLASNRGRALIELARPMAHEVVARVREIVEGSGVPDGTPAPPAPGRKAAERKRRKAG